jgi:glycosyltransferase involved in cell wall biosynthesis
MFAITPLEAMQIGLPVILSKSAAMGSLVEDGETGYTFESGSAESLAVTLAKALADPARLAKMGRLAQARFLAGDCPPQRNVAALCRAYVRPLSGRTQMQEKL